MGGGLSISAPSSENDGFVGIHPRCDRARGPGKKMQGMDPPQKLTRSTSARLAGTSWLTSSNNSGSGNRAQPAQAFQLTTTQAGKSERASPLVPLQLRQPLSKSSSSNVVAASPHRSDDSSRGHPTPGKGGAKRKPVLLHLLKQALVLASEKYDENERFRREEKHIVMQMYDILGLYEDRIRSEPSNQLQESLNEYVFPPINMASLRHCLLDTETMREVLGDREAARRLAEGHLDVAEEDANNHLGSDCLLKKQLRRRGVSSETQCNVGDVYTLGTGIRHEKTAGQVKRLTEIVKNNILFKPLDSRDRLALFNSLQEESFPADHTIIQQGDEGDSYFIIETGQCEVFVCDEEDDDDPDPVMFLGEGDSFGELALMYGTQRAATVRTVTDTLCWVLDRDTYRGMFLTMTCKKRERYMGFLDNISILSSLSPYEKARIADMLDPYEAEPGEVVCQEGSTGDTFFMIEAGCVSVQTEANGEVCQLGPDDYFGELALLYCQPRKATVVALEKTHLVLLRRKEFDNYLGSLSELRMETTRYMEVPGGESPLMRAEQSDSELGALLDNIDDAASPSSKKRSSPHVPFNRTMISCEPL